MDINERVMLVYQLMIMSNETDEEIREYLYEIDNVIFSSKALSLEAFDMFDLLKYKYMEEYKKACDLTEGYFITNA